MTCWISVAVLGEATEAWSRKLAFVLALIEKLRFPATHSDPEAPRQTPEDPWSPLKLLPRAVCLELP